MKTKVKAKSDGNKGRGRHYMTVVIHVEHELDAGQLHDTVCNTLSDEDCVQGLLELQVMGQFLPEDQ